MARARNIKPSLFKNELLGVADPLLTILFESLWCIADKEGRLEDRPLRIKAETFPYRDGIDINGLLTELERLGFIQRYKVGDVAVIQVLNFLKHQHPHHTEKASELPAFTSTCHVTVNPPLETESTPSDSLTTDSLIPDSRKEEAAKPAASTDPVEARIWNDGVELLRRSGLSELSARSFLGKMVADYSAEWVGESIAAAQAKNSPDPKAYIIGILRNRKRPDVGKQTEPVDKANCVVCCDTGTEIIYPDPSRSWISEKRPCPNGCTQEAVAA